MSQFITMLDALAVAVQTLADGGGPFWEPTVPVREDAKNSGLEVSRDSKRDDSSEYPEAEN